MNARSLQMIGATIKTCIYYRNYTVSQIQRTMLAAPLCYSEQEGTVNSHHQLKKKLPLHRQRRILVIPAHSERGDCTTQTKKEKQLNVALKLDNRWLRRKVIRCVHAYGQVMRNLNWRLSLKPLKRLFFFFAFARAVVNVTEGSIEIETTVHHHGDQLTTIFEVLTLVTW